MKPYSQPGFFDLQTRTAKLTEMGDPLVELNVLIDWEAFRPDLLRIHRQSAQESGRCHAQGCGAHVQNTGAATTA